LPTLPPGTSLPPPRVVPANQPAPLQEEQPSPAPEPQPVNVPMPNSTQTQTSSTPPQGGVSPSTSARNGGAVQQQVASGPTPAPLPSAFTQTNVFTFGAAPQNNYAAANAAPQIFYVQVKPSVVHNGDPMTISAITSTNVAKLTFGANSILSMASLQSVGPGQWQGSFNFSNAGLPIGQSTVSLSLTATTGLGSNVSLPIPISLLSP
jgi:hypothetical protein